MPLDLALFFVEQADAVANEDLDVAIDSIRNALCCKMDEYNRKELRVLLRCIEEKVR